MTNTNINYMLKNGRLVATNTDKFNRLTASTSTKTNIINNKLEVAIERYPNIKGTEIDRVLRTLASITAEADRHIAEGDEFFNYKDDKVRALVRIDILIKEIYEEDGDIDLITESVSFTLTEARARELSDHYWAISHNN